MDLKKFIRSIPDYPKKGILFRDITTLIKSPEAFKFTNDKIIEIAAIKFLNGDPVDRFVKLINPERPIDPFITDITGISDKMLKGQPIESEILDDFLEFLSDLPTTEKLMSLQTGEKTRGNIFPKSIFQLVFTDFFYFDSYGNNR